jgi:hypothetical protein
MTPLAKLKKKGELPKLWPTMPGHVLFVRWATKESATPVIAIRNETGARRLGPERRIEALSRANLLALSPVPNTRW